MLPNGKFYRNLSIESYTMFNFHFGLQAIGCTLEPTVIYALKKKVLVFVQNLSMTESYTK